MDEILKIKESYKNYIKELINNLSSTEIDENDTISLFHGTNALHLNSIFSEGILPRNIVNIDNWKSNPSIEDVVYLTTKWHYFYAINSSMVILDEKNVPSFPCYIECAVPKALLVADEDFLFSNYVKNKVKKCIKKNIPLDITWEESLNYYGTVGVLKSVPKKYIKSFTVLGDPKLVEYLINPNEQYMKDFYNWQKGKGKGVLKKMDLLRMETKSNRNATWWIDKLPKDFRIKEIKYDPIRNTTRLFL